MLKKLFFVSVAFILSASGAYAADYLPKEKASGGNVTVAGDGTYRNLYVGGGNVAVNKAILGDLFAAGGSVNLIGTIEKDLFVVGGNVSVTRTVGEDARIAGGNISISAPIGGDLLVAGGTIVIAGGDIGGDLWAAGGALSVNSRVAGDARIAGGEIFINSTIAGDVEIVAQDRLTFGPQANIAGTVVYRGAREAVLEEGANVPNLEFKQVERARGGAALGAAIGVVFLWKLIALFVAGLILLRLFPKASSSIVATSATKPWLSLGVGFVGLVTLPLLAVVLALTVLGIYAGTLVALAYALMLCVSAPYMLMLIGGVVEKWIRKQEKVALSWKSVVWGTLVGGVIFLVPIIGTLLIFVLFLMAFGGMLQAVRYGLVGKR